MGYESGTPGCPLNTYNALGQRVEDVTQTSTTDEAYGAGGNLLLRYTGDSNSRSFVPFNGRILAEYYCGGMIFDHPDEIGSLTTATDCTGNTVNETLYYPYGEHWTGALMPNLGAHPMFAKLPDYDAETDQFNTLNRHYSPSGRWMSPDPGGVKIVNLQDPQTWNMYAYVRNNPATLTDPSGLGEEDVLLIEAGVVALRAIAWTAGAIGAVSTAQALNANADSLSAAAGSLAQKLGSTPTDVQDAKSAALARALGLQKSDSTDKKVPNPNGSKGAPDHQQTADEEADSMEGGQREVRIPTPGGNKDTRVADAAEVDENGNPRPGGKIVQVYRPTPAGNIPQREQDAAQDIQNATGTTPTMVPVRPVKPCPAGQTCNR